MAVYTKVSDQDAEEFLQAYDLGALRELAPISQGVENSNYFLTTGQGRFVLTLYEKRVQEEDLPFFLALMEHLATKGIPAPLPVKNTAGQFLGRLCGRPAAITTFLTGSAPTRITADECAEVGHALARMHLAASDFGRKRENNLGLSGWEKLVAFTKGRADEIYYGLGKLLQKEIDYLAKHWPKNLPSGVVHTDLFPDNVFLENGKLCGVIDFYFACNDFFAYDLAVCLNAWCFETNHTSFNITKARALLKGYQEVRPLTKDEIAALPVLARGSALRFLLTRLYDWLNQQADALVRPKDPLDYLARLQFHRAVENVSAYGLDG